MNSDSELIQVKEDTLFLGSPISRDHHDNPHASPDPRVRSVLPFHVRLPQSSLIAPAGYQRASSGAPAEASIKVFEVFLTEEWLKLVVVNSNPFHEWGEGKIEGDVIDAAELHAELREVYHDFLED